VPRSNHSGSPTNPDDSVPGGEAELVDGGTTADRLLANAARLFRTKGYAATSTRELSELLGLQKASLYYHMGSKEDLLFDLCISTLEEVAQVFDEAISEGGTSLEILHRLATRYLKEALEDADKHATMLVEIRALSEARRSDVIRRRDFNVARVQEVVAACQAEGLLSDDVSPKYLTLALFNLLNWTIFWFSSDGELTIQEMGELLWSVFASGVTRHDTAAKRPKSPSSTRRATKVVRDV
jgi:TetR/AcrR family transcriptional regulator, cholesterol catabolism regulator